ncbi:MAG: helix-turn-helix domain-containing protein [Methanobacteriota archaeon]
MGQRSRSSDSGHADRPNSGADGSTDSGGVGSADAARSGSDAPRGAERARATARSGDTGVRVEIVVHDPARAPVAAALPPGAVAEDVDRVRVDDAVVSQFRADRAVDAELVFDGGDERVYRCRSRATGQFPSDTVESLGYPVSSVTVRTAPDRVRLRLSLPAADPLGDVIDALEATGGSVRLERLTSSGGADTRSDPVVVDRGRLTERQREVVRTAHRLGYFEHPRGASATEVADAIGIARATFSEHLAAAQRRVFEDLVGG